MAYLQITLDISNENRMAAAGVYQKYKTPFLTTIEGATSKELLSVMRMSRCCTVLDRGAGATYLSSPLFTQDVVAGLKPYLNTRLTYVFSTSCNDFSETKKPEFSMFLNWNEYRSGLLATIGKFAKLQPEFMKGFQKMDKGRQKTSTSIPKPMN
jgi:hypothetical protein